MPYSSQGVSLSITFGEHHREVGADEPFTFGRAGSLVVDEANRELHRVQGTLRHHGDTWWVHNNGRSAALVITDLESPSFTRVAPETALPLPYASCAITFSAGRANYRIDVHNPDHGQAPPPVTAPPEVAETTLTTGQMVFNDEQFALLVAISEPRLAGPITAADLATNRQIAQRLGWTATKVTRKLDNLCIKLHKAGVNGLRGDTADVASLRRVNLANYAVETGIVTAEAVQSLNEATPPS